MDLDDDSLTLSATPPCEDLRLVVSLKMTPKPGEEHDVLMLMDITRAHPHCTIRREVWIALHAEDPRASEDGTCGFLLRSLYGLRDAGQGFELFLADTMVKHVGFQVR